jgi:hypothetical protein
MKDLFIVIFTAIISSGCTFLLLWRLSRKSIVLESQTEEELAQKVVDYMRGGRQKKGESRTATRSEEDWSNDEIIDYTFFYQKMVKWR